MDELWQRMVERRLRILEQPLSTAPLPTTVGATRIARMEADRWDVPVPEPTTPTEQTSSPLDPAGIESGRAGRACVCVRPRPNLNANREPISVSPSGVSLITECLNCGAYVQYVRTLAPAAATTTSTSQSEPSQH